MILCFFFFTVNTFNGIVGMSNFAETLSQDVVSTLFDYFYLFININIYILYLFPLQKRLYLTTYL